MKNFLLIGLNPENVETPAAKKLLASVAEEQRLFAAQGDHMDLCALDSDASSEAPVTARLAQTAYDCVLIGGGIREPEKLELFERIINAIHRHAPNAAIAFVNLPQNAIETAARVFSLEYQGAGLIAQS